MALLPLAKAGERGLHVERERAFQPVAEARFRPVERGDHREDQQVALRRLDPARGKAAPGGEVRDPIVDRLVRHARLEEVAVQRMR